MGKPGAIVWLVPCRQGPKTIGSGDSSEMMRSSVTMAKKYLSLASVTPPRYWTDPVPLERARMEYEIEVNGRFLKWFPELRLEGKDVLDIGCGNGGSAVRFAELGARRVIGLEPFNNPCKEGLAFAVEKGVGNVNFIVALGEQIPLRSNGFDVITSYDVFEHVEDLGKVLDECVRILRPGGTLYAIFPPFYHPTGAHLDSWISRMPWPNVLFSCATLVRAVSDILKSRNDGYEPNPMRLTDRLWALNGATIRSVRRLLAHGKCSRARLVLYPIFSPMNSRWKSWRMKYYAFAFKPLRYVPVLQELFVHRMVLTITKLTDKTQFTLRPSANGSGGE
jgi:SAM-dependent methyltransferase